jgi:hypothetical protein
MGILVPAIVVIISLGSRYLIELSTELTSGVMLDTDAGVISTGGHITASRIIDMRPEASIVGLDVVPVAVPAALPEVPAAGQ